jgi:hypothetical protein
MAYRSMWRSHNYRRTRNYGSTVFNNNHDRLASSYYT